MIFNTIAAGGTTPEYIWIEYTKPSELFSIIAAGVSTGDIKQRQVNLPKPSGDYLYYVYPQIIVSDSHFGQIEGVRGTGQEIPSNWTSIPGYYCLDGGKWVGGLSICETADFNTGARFCSIRYNAVYFLQRLAKTSPIKAVHLTEQTGDQFAKIPIIK